MPMKKIILMTSFALFLLLLTGCGSDAVEPNAQPEQNAEDNGSFVLKDMDGHAVQVFPPQEATLYLYFTGVG